MLLEYIIWFPNIVVSGGGALPPGTATRLTTGMAGNRPGTRGGAVGGGVGVWRLI